MCLTEYNEEVFVNGIRTEGFNEGIELGIERGKSESVDSLISKLDIPLDEALNIIGITMEEYEAAKA